MTDIRKKLQDIVAGLEGVTPGPYYQSGHPWFRDGTGVLAGSPDGNIAVMIADTDIMCGERHEYDGPIELGDPVADAAHFTRCDPDTIREINQVVEKLDKENEHLVYGMHQTDNEIEEKRFQLQEMSKSLDSRDAQIACLKLEFAAKDAEIEQLREALHCVTRPLERTIRVLDSIAQSAAARGDTTGEMLAEGEARALRDCRHAALNRKED